MQNIIETFKMDSFNYGRIVTFVFILIIVCILKILMQIIGKLNYLSMVTNSRKSLKKIK